MNSQFRVRAPELVGPGQWLNTGGKDLSLNQLRGKIVILDFWTFCCINCLHVLDELRQLEEKYHDVLVVIGVHSPKFEHEAELAAVEAAVARYDVAHPVLNDPAMKAWQEYAVRAWPTLAVIDPEGYVVAQHSGEGHAHALDILLAELVAKHEASGTLNRGDGPYVPAENAERLLNFPAKIVSRASQFWVADSGHHQIQEFDSDIETPLRRIGDGKRGFRDGNFATSQFNEPNGIAVLPDEVAAEVGYHLVVADTVNHALRAVNLDREEVWTIAGTGQQWMQGDGPEVSVAATSIRLSSPWDVIWWPAQKQIVIAMAGIHQIWQFSPYTSEISVLAGTTNEGLVDGEYLKSWFAQTSGLAISNDGETLWIADSETSALRALRNGLVRTAVGVGLFDFGFRDGPAANARLQHPLGIAVLADDSVAIADTYNNAVRRYDSVTDSVTTLFEDLAEPSGLLLLPDNRLVVVESAAHRLLTLQIPNGTLNQGEALRTKRPAQRIGSGKIKLRIGFTPPAGQKLDDRYGPSTYLVVSSSPAELLSAGAGSGIELTREIEIADPALTGISTGVLHVSARAASCDIASENEFPACHMHQQDWGVPIEIVEAGDGELTLLLAGL